jgi:predicted TPR repeat methyltransferase
MQQYDEMASTYDATLLNDWGYQAPAVAADLLARHVELKSTILDVGCGTGLTGHELRRVGFACLRGVDISEPSLQTAAGKGVYESLVRADLMEPLPFSDNTFDGAICVGVLSYISGDGLFRELCRVVRAGGTLVLSHRTDLVVQREFGKLIGELEAEGLWSAVATSANLPYLPGHPDFGTGIEVQFFTLKVL